MTSQQIVGIIPARYGSSRLPAKPLAEIGGRPMILHVLDRAAKVPGLDRVVVATDDERIRAVVAGAGGEAFLTDPAHPSGTDRIAEAARLMDLSDEDVVVNIQGDQPLLDPAPVQAIVQRLLGEPDLPMTTPACPLDLEDYTNPNRVKVVVGKDWRALYFSRASIPFDRDGVLKKAGSVAGLPPYPLRHLGLYAYRQAFLQRFVTLETGGLEQVEQLEQLRALENGYAIGVVLVAQAPLEVDTAEDLAAVRSVVTGQDRPLQ